MSETKFTNAPWHTGGTFNPGTPRTSQNVWGATPKGMQSGEIIAKDVPLRYARLIAAAPELLEALQAYERLDEQHANCPECEDSPEMAPEACAECFPFADDARLKMRAAIAKATGKETT